MLKPVTPMSSPQRGGIFTSSRPPSAMDQAGFDEEVRMNLISMIQFLLYLNPWERGYTVLLLCFGLSVSLKQIFIEDFSAIIIADA